MPDCLAASDLVIARAGAMTLAELTAVGRASVLIPSPNVAENHQYHNAMVLADHHAAVVIEEKDLTGEMLVKTVKELTEDPGRLRRLLLLAGRRSAGFSYENLIKKFLSISSREARPVL